MPSNREPTQKKPDPPTPPFRIEGPQQGRSSCLHAQQQREAWEEALKLLRYSQRLLTEEGYRFFPIQIQDFLEKHHE